MKFRYKLIKNWRTTNFRFTFFPTFSYLGQSNTVEKIRGVNIRWLCFIWVFEWYKTRRQVIKLPNTLVQIYREQNLVYKSNTD